MADEDFDIDTLAAYLHLTPAQVRRMADRDRLPGRKIGGQWKFSRAEIHHWMEDRIGTSDEQELVEVETVLERQCSSTSEDVCIVDLLAVDSISIPLVARTKNSVIETLCEFTANQGLLWDPSKMAEAIRNREQLHPTALENGVALLHPRRTMPNILADSFLALGVTTQGIPFGGPRGTLTDIFFLIGSASDQTHLRILARLSRLLVDATMIEQIRQAENADAAWDAIRDADQEIQ